MIKFKLFFIVIVVKKKIKYIDEEGKDYIFISEKENFFDIKCEDNKIRKKINYAIREIVK